jgi:hypothetical protein
MDPRSPAGTQFSTHRILTMSRINKLIKHFLSPFIGDQAKFYSCKSFRATLTSDLASHPRLENDVHIKRWGDTGSWRHSYFLFVDGEAEGVTS